MTTIDQAAYFTSAQQAMSRAKTDKDLRAVVGLIDQPDFLILPEACQEDLLAQYAQTMLRVSGALMP